MFKPEVEEGNIEYKWRLDFKSDLNLKKLVSQILWRLHEGNDLYGIYEAHYILGIKDKGELGKLTLEQLDLTINIFKKSLEKASAYIIFEKKYEFIEDEIINNIAYLHIRKIPQSKVYKDMYILLLGSSSVGKTTFINSICNELPDDGKGFGRSHILRYEHEKLSGHTSSIKREIIGTNNKDEILNYKSHNEYNEIVQNSEYIINIIDTPGKLSYIKTTLFALHTYHPDIIFIFCSDINDELCHTYIAYCEQTNIDFIILFNKQDLHKNINRVNNIKSEYLFRNKDKIIEFSNVTFHNMILIKNKIISKIKEIKINEELYYVNKNKSNLLSQFNNISVFRMNEIFNVPERGKMISGIVTQGQINTTDKLLLIESSTTNYDSQFKSNCTINTIFKKNLNSFNIKQNESSTINLLNAPSKIDKYSLLIKFNNLDGRYTNDIIQDIKELYTNKLKIKLTYGNCINYQNDNIHYIVINGNGITRGTINKEPVDNNLDETDIYTIKLNNYIIKQTNNVILYLPNANKHPYSCFEHLKFDILLGQIC